MPSEKPSQPDLPDVVHGDGTGPLPTLTLEIEGCVLGHWRGMMIGAWAVPSTLELMAEQDRLMTLLSTHARKQSTVQVVLKPAPLPDAKVRAAYKDMLQRHGSQIGCAALLVKAEGFWASAVRGFMTSMQLLDRSYRSRTFGDIEQLAAWTAPLHSAESGLHVTAEELIVALEWVLARPVLRDRPGD